MLYNVQIVDMREIITKLPNLKFVTLMNMKTFNCNWLQLLPEDVHLKTNLCQSYTRASDSDSQKYLTSVSDDLNVPNFHTRYPVDNISTNKGFEQITRLFTEKSMENSIYRSNKENNSGMYTVISGIYEWSTSK